MNSSYDNVEKARRRTGPADVWLNRQDAANRGLSDGSHVVLSNEAGRLSVSVVCSDIVPAGVALVHKGRWPKLDPSSANVNVLNPGHKTDVGESSSVHSIEVEILIEAP
jgi:anaerobic selenocysteine-containing dehydrogenase